MMNVVDSVKVLSLSDVKLCLDVVINLLKCFPHLEKLYFKVNPCVEVLNNASACLIVLKLS